MFNPIEIKASARIFVSPSVFGNSIGVSDFSIFSADSTVFLSGKYSFFVSLIVSTVASVVVSDSVIVELTFEFEQPLDNRMIVHKVTK